MFSLLFIYISSDIFCIRPDTSNVRQSAKTCRTYAETVRMSCSSDDLRYHCLGSAIVSISRYPTETEGCCWIRSSQPPRAHQEGSPGTTQQRSNPFTCSHIRYEQNISNPIDDAITKYRKENILELTIAFCS